MHSPGAFLSTHDARTGAESRENVKEKAILFIDSANFDNFVRKKTGKPTRWLDYPEFSRRVVPEGEHWQETRYYAGQLKQEGNPDLYKNQRKFLASLKRTKDVSYHLGRVVRRPVIAEAESLCSRLDNLRRRGDVSLGAGAAEELDEIIATLGAVRYMEKEVDVLIAADMISMAHNGDYDVAYLLTADRDFAPAVRRVRETGKKVVVASPVYAGRLMQEANDFILLTEEYFEGCWL